jgi:hypothetical protein
MNQYSLYGHTESLYATLDNRYYGPGLTEIGMLIWYACNYDAFQVSHG